MRTRFTLRGERPSPFLPPSVASLSRNVTTLSGVNFCNGRSPYHAYSGRSMDVYPAMVFGLALRRDASQPSKCCATVVVVLPTNVPLISDARCFA